MAPDCKNVYSHWLLLWHIVAQSSVFVFYIPPPSLTMSYISVIQKRAKMLYKITNLANLYSYRQVIKVNNFWRKPLSRVADKYHKRPSPPPPGPLRDGPMTMQCHRKCINRGVAQERSRLRLWESRDRRPLLGYTQQRTSIG